jgi:hypothetical protein
MGKVATGHLLLQVLWYSRHGSGLGAKTKVMFFLTELNPGQ